MSESKAVGRPKREQKKRVPLGQRNRLSVSGLDQKNFVYRFINDVDDRIDRAQEAGYEFVEGDVPIGDAKAAEASQMGAKSAKGVGNNTTAYLMRIPKKYYEADQKAKAEKIDEIEAAFKPQKSKNQYGEGLQYD